MDADLQATVVFHLTGKRADGEPCPFEGTGLRPALLAGYRDLTRLRYDFPVVLVRDASDEVNVESLSRLIDQALEKVAPPGRDGERLRTHALRLEQQVRAMAAAGATGSLSEVLDAVACRLTPVPNDAFAESLRRLRAALPADGEVLDCDGEMPGRLIAHVWRALQRKKAAAFHQEVDELIVKLGDILWADRSRSQAARSPASLKASLGPIHSELFDLEAMSRLLAGVSSGSTLTESRRRRIESTLAVLEAQRFYAAPGDGALEFEFDDCASALEAFRQRIPEMAKLARAMTIAKLEIDGAYSEPRHDALFERLAAGGHDLPDMAMFPDYLVCVNAQDLRLAKHGELMEILASGLPIKVLVQSDDILEQPLVANGHLAFGARSRQFANMAIGLNDVFVMQTSGSNLFQCRDRICRAMNYPGPALFSVFSGATGQSGDIPSYLVAAAAMESRAFPAFTYDPGAGPDWASRFSLDGNPQAERDWPLHKLKYEDPDRQRVAEEIAFTLLDFVACDWRYAEHFAAVPRANWSSALAPAAECVNRESKGLPDKLPILMMVDRDNLLQKVIVDDRLIREARRCCEMWHSLQELGGIHNSHAQRLLARERERWDESRKSEVRAPAAAVEAPAPAAPATPAAPAAPAALEEARPSDEPYIETPRCSSCDECIQINNRMFAYDANKQARIVDLNAGTYRQLVEAAESCQVAVIHPGKPKNPNESGLDELLKRAEPFL